MKRSIKNYCTGCGLCTAINKSILKEGRKGFLHPISVNDEWNNRVCPASGVQTKFMDREDIWGRNVAVYLGWSTTEFVRKQASSGGVLTELASYLLEHGLIDEIIHTCVDEENPTKAKLTYSHSREELISKCGSRYSISHPLLEIDKIDFEKKYLFIGKPCDVIALKNYMRINSKLSSVIPYTFSFFCAGLPSTDAQRLLLKKMGTSSSKCVSLKYRGDGWPGYTTALNEDGTIYTLDYHSAWGLTLGRDIMKACRVCFDGIGEMADISCGDAWYKTENGKPDFSEQDGRNVIFARSEKGSEIIKGAVLRGYIQIKEFPEYSDYLKQIQKYQYERKVTMRVKLLVMKLFGRSIPYYDKSTLLAFDKEADKEMKKNVAVGTIKRLIKGKL